MPDRLAARPASPPHQAGGGHAWLIAAVLVAHVCALGLPSVNLEFAFADATGYFARGEQAPLAQYFSYQANTLGLPWLGAQGLALLPWLAPLTVLRLLAIAGIGLFAAAVLRIARHLGTALSPALLAVFLLNPLVWTYSARATADFLPVALGLFAISLALGEARWPLRSLGAGVLLGAASVLKYHELCLLPVLLALLWAPGQARRAWLGTSLVGAVALALLLGYLDWAHTQFGFWLTPRHFQHVHGVAGSHLVSNFIAYAGYLALLALPYPLLVPGLRRFQIRHWPLWLALAVVLFWVGASGVHDNGEMNLGPLDRWVGKPALAGGFLLAAVACALPCLASGDAAPGAARRRLAWAVLAVLAVLAFSRPAQRYLLPVLPCFLLALPAEVWRRRWLNFALVAAFVLADLFISYSQWCTGAAAQAMTEAIAQAQWLDRCDPGVIEGHVGNRFPKVSRAQLRYVVVEGAAPGALMTVTKGVAPIARTYALVPRTAP